jgi:acyl-CoA synthetase (AMP-forming)/AMP-acid ligase II
LENCAAVATPGTGLTFIDRRENETLIDWPDVHRRTHRAAGALAEAGVKPGDRVAIILPTCPEFIDALFGLQQLGAIPVPLYPPVRLGRLTEYYDKTAAMLKAVSAAALITTGRVRRVMGQVIARYAPPLGIIEATTLHHGPEHPRSDVSPDALCMVQFSSGTTVAPKPVALTHAQVLSNAKAILGVVLDHSNETPAGVCWLPLYHDMGLIGCVYLAVAGAGPLALISPEVFLARPALWLRAISRHRATASPAPNFAYALCAERIRDEEMEGVDLSSWKLALNGAEPVAPASLRMFTERFMQWGLDPNALTPVYGLAEASLAVTFSDPGRPFSTRFIDRDALLDGQIQPATKGVEAVSVGTPLPGFAIEIRDDSGDGLPERIVGHIWAKGPSIMHSYLDRPDTPVVNGWLNTGDLGYLLDGELYIAGREKDVVILRGQNHIPQDIEQAVDDVDGVRVGCAAAVGDLTEDGERLVLFIEFREARAGLAEDCRRVVLKKTGLNPDLVVLVAPGTIPRTSSGKIRRTEALRQWKVGDLKPPDKVTPWLLAGAMASSALGYLKSRRS